MSHWVYTNEQLPPVGRYVLVHLKDMPWHDRSDQEGVVFKVAKLIKGISLAERDIYLEHGNPRGKVIQFGDADGNNILPYKWETFGASAFFGHEVDRWMEIPRRLMER